MSDPGRQEFRRLPQACAYLFSPAPVRAPEFARSLDAGTLSRRPAPGPAPQGRRPRIIALGRAKGGPVPETGQNFRAGILDQALSGFTPFVPPPGIRPLPGNAGRFVAASVQNPSPALL